MERDLHRTLVKKRSKTFPVDLNVPAVITSGQNEIGDDDGDSTANKTVHTTGVTASTFQEHGINQVGTSSGTHTGPYMSLLLGLDGRTLDEIPANTIDDIAPRSQIRYPHGNEGGYISYLGQEHSFSLPTTHEHCLSVSAGGMASALPSNSTFAGHMQSQAANIKGSVMSPTNMQSQYVGGSVPPGLLGGFQGRILQSPAEKTGRTLLPHSLGITSSGNNIAPDRTRLNRSPSPLLVGNYSGVVSDVPTGFMSNTNAGQSAIQLAGSLNDSRWRDYGATASLNHSWSYQNQVSGGGFLRASPGNKTASRTWNHMGGRDYQTVVPQLDASFLGTGLAGNGTGGSQSLAYNPRVDNMHSDVIMLNDGGQSSEQIATCDLNSIMEGAVRGAYEFDYWIIHGRPPSPTQVSSSVPPLPASGGSSAPQSQGQSTEQLVSMANQPLPVPEPSPSFRSPISDKQSGKAIVSPSDAAAGSPRFQNNSDSDN